MHMRLLGLTAVMLSIVGTVVTADDWPTHLHDNERTGKSLETLTLPLRTHWKQRLPQPQPAWPAPAKQDYWHHKTNLRPRIVHDRANSIVVASGKLIVGSSADDQVRAFDVESGSELWQSFAEAPIRLAPTIWTDRVLFGADDGYIYQVDLETGSMQWKVRPDLVGPRRIPGNGRIISERPVRSGVLVDEKGTGYFVAGIFPKYGAHFFSFDPATGKILDHASIEKSVQGYLQQRDGRIHAPTGRDPHGVVLSGQKSASKTKSAELDRETFSRIEDQRYEYLGRDGEVVAQKNGNPIWRADVEGRVYAMAIADGKLFASTDLGWLYAFGPEDAQLDLAKPKPQTVKALRGENNVESASNRPAFILHIAPDPKQLLSDTTANPNQRFIAAVDSVKSANAIRSQLISNNVAVHIHPSLDELPYADNIFHRIHGGKLANVQRMLSPNGGVAHCIDGAVSRDGQHSAGTWTHAYGTAGNIASSTAQVGTQLKLQWFGGPGPRNMVDRHMRTMPPLAVDGLLYVAGLNRVITVDAYTGAVLWEKEIPNSTRIGILKDCGWMAADRQRLFVAVEDRCLGIETDKQGKRSTTYEVKVPIPDRHWGYVARVGEYLIGSGAKPNASRRTIARDSILEGAYSDDRPVVASDSLFVAFADEAEVTWQYNSSGLIPHPTIAASDKMLFFLENEVNTSASELGRVLMKDFLNGSAKLVAMDLESGERVWSTTLPPVENAQNAYLLCDRERVILVNSRNTKTVQYDVTVFNAANGEELWTATQDNQDKTGGDHGEQDKHPVLTGNALIVEPFAYDIDTGHKLTDLDLNQRGYGCGTISASAKALFFRSGNPAGFSLETKKLDLITKTTRPGCWINMIPASGLLIIPEGSSGCTCNFAIQTSMALTTE